MTDTWASTLNVKGVVVAMDLVHEGLSLNFDLHGSGTPTLAANNDAATETIGAGPDASLAVFYKDQSTLNFGINFLMHKVGADPSTDVSWFFDPAHNSVHQIFPLEGDAGNTYEVTASIQTAEREAGVHGWIYTPTTQVYHLTVVFA